MRKKKSKESSEGPSLYQRIYDVARQIPPGQVATYGQIAKIVGRCSPRTVGYAMSSTPYGSDVPWHRVINSQGKVSVRGRGGGDSVQQQLLEQEDVRFNAQGRVNLKIFLWPGPDMN
ncbi:MAG: methylated-DNA--[protein]-cysteine S-methyltransferase [Deltaproteobacteria bacterium]|nr:methylated-DNA--[protein]-cysteine S-methyltransferase [Deltaproteobacteria bacterium]MBW2052441.1 methylated-DNA--[protein]-cysteine S-methyltransferase [Deltaproteobacteria bacterium]MBW2142443.1 methylated-DNA--[protein]-cysteine S-methyltransferase [Deltaproteobacteria bacterium]MBW2324073.1 methylated-DNA--[protein]-cysteine S-methyltransferase [Deltaproteobacteria bacterium]